MDKFSSGVVARVGVIQAFLIRQDDQGIRLAKRHEALSLRHLREQGRSPEEIRASLF